MKEPKPQTTPNSVEVPDEVMNWKQQTPRKKKRKPAVLYCVRNTMGFLLFTSCSPIRDMVISDVEERTGSTWQELYRDGFRCLKMVEAGNGR